jgi:hypothetical protein
MNTVEAPDPDRGPSESKSARGGGRLAWRHAEGDATPEIPGGLLDTGDGCHADNVRNADINTALTGSAFAASARPVQSDGDDLDPAPSCGRPRNSSSHAERRGAHTRNSSASRKDWAEIQESAPLATTLTADDDAQFFGLAACATAHARGWRRCRLWT